MYSGTRERSGFGRLSTNLGSSALLLKNAQGEWIRASFNEDRRQTNDKVAEVSIPTGTYTLGGYRLSRADDAGKEWMVSVSGLTNRKVTVPEGGRATVDVDPSVKVTAKIARNQVQMMVSAPGDGSAGATLYKEGKRIPMRYRVLAEDGKELRSGSITYG